MDYLQAAALDINEETEMDRRFYRLPGHISDAEPLYIEMITALPDISRTTRKGWTIAHLKWMTHA